MLSLTQCNSSSGSTASSSTPPVPYCSTVTTYSSPAVITGSAEYEYRTNGNGAVATPKPIRHAEIRVTNSAGSLIQCSETDASGNFSLNLPNDGSSATISITSRADNTFVKAYILANPTQNTFHSISKSVTLDASKSVGTLTASATGTLEGGAFNILDKVLDSNDFLRTATANCQITFTNCIAFTIAPLVSIYWDKGVDPGSYFNLPPLSFFLPDRNELYILGGVGGDIDNTDTDHFDDTIIIHEYGHFIEHNFSITDSPGGSHNGDNLLDPRLAWGEAWSNYFQAIVTGSSVYRDTYGTPLGTSGVYVNENLESGTADTATEADEGNFREFSITRALVDLTDADEMNASDDLQTSFAEFWTIFAGTTGGFADTSMNFRSIGLFYVLQNALVGKSNWSTIQTAEDHLALRTNYANTLSAGAACPTVILAEDVPGASPSNGPGRQPEDGSFVNSNQFKSNDFYQITHAGGALNITMTYTTTPANAANLDLFLYENEYSFGDTTTMSAASEDINSIAASGDTEIISLGSLAAGTYLLNVHYDTASGIRSAASYSLTVNATSVCPD